MRRVTAAEAAMLLPRTVDAERMQQAIAWLGISRELVGTMSSVRFEPTRVVFELVDLDDTRRTISVEARVTR